MNWNDESGVIVVAPSCYWGQLTDELKGEQIVVVRRWQAWQTHFHLLTATLPKQQAKALIDAEQKVSEWIQLASNWSLTSVPDHNGKTLTGHFTALFDFLRVLEGQANQRVILIPDTNAILAAPDLAAYASVAGADQFDVVFLPTMIGELDKLKIVHRDETFRKKVEGVISRLKGFRTQGDPIGGVTVHKTIRVRFIAHEPRMEASLPWFDPVNADDRLIASALEVQIGEPTAIVTLVTRDLNMQNKAHAAFLPYAEPPKEP